MKWRTFAIRAAVNAASTERKSTVWKLAALAGLGCGVPIKWTNVSAGAIAPENVAGSRASPITVSAPAGTSFALVLRASAHGVAAREQRRNKGAADIARGAGNENAAGRHGRGIGVDAMRCVSSTRTFPSSNASCRCSRRRTCARIRACRRCRRASPTTLPVRRRPCRLRAL